MKRIAVSLLLVLGLACSMPATKIYSLNIMAERTEKTAPRAASLTISVQAQRYLLQPYIAHRVSAYQLDIARYAKWDSSPADMVRDAFRDVLVPEFREVRVTHALSTEFYTLQVYLRRFEMSGSGADASCELAMDVNVIAPDGHELFRKSVNRQGKLDGSDYVSLAKGMSVLLDETVAELRADLLQRIK